MPPRSSTNPAIFTVLFRASHKSKRMEKNRCILLFSRTISHFQGQFYKIPGQFQDKWHYFEIPGVFQDQGQIQGLFQVCANPGRRFSKDFYHIWACQPSWSSDQHYAIRFSFPCTRKLSYKIWFGSAQLFLRKIQFGFLYVHDLGPRSRNNLDLQYSHIFRYSTKLQITGCNSF